MLQQVLALQAVTVGAGAVLLGQPVLYDVGLYKYGLDLQGEEGVGKMLQMLSRELTLAMQLAECMSLQTLTESLILPFENGVPVGHASNL